LDKLKAKLKKATVWFVENKDKTLDQILVDRWKEKCSAANLKCPRKGKKNRRNPKNSPNSCKKTQSSKKKRCVEAGLAEADDDTEDVKEIKETLKDLLEEDSDEIFEFLDKFSSRTIADIENEEEINEKLTSLPSSFQDKWEEGGYKTFSDLQTEYKEETEKVQEKAKKAFSIKRKIRKVLSKITSNKNRIIRHARDLGSRESGCSEEDIKSSYQRCQRKNVKAKKSRRSNCQKKQSEAKSSCISLAFSDQEGDTDTDKSVKDDMKKILTEDVDEGFNFLEDLDVNVKGPGEGACCECRVGARKTEGLTRSKRQAQAQGQAWQPVCGLDNIWVPRNPEAKTFPASASFLQKHVVDEAEFNLQPFFDRTATEEQINDLGNERERRTGRWVNVNTIISQQDLNRLRFKMVTAQGPGVLPEDAAVYNKQTVNVGPGTEERFWFKHRAVLEVNYITMRRRRDGTFRYDMGTGYIQVSVARETEDSEYLEIDHFIDVSDHALP